MQNKDDNVVRVVRDTAGWEVLSLSMGPSEHTFDERYAPAALPACLRTPISVLELLPAPPPPNDISGLGRRIGADIFWVYMPT